jgi:hypothetical protein
MSHQTVLSKNTKLTLAMVVALACIYAVQPYISEFIGSEKKTSPEQKSEPNATLPAAPQTETTPVPSLIPGTDPFKAHIEKNSTSGNKSSASAPLKPSTLPTLPSGNTVSSGSDPFKAFLDEQKKQSKEAGVSPFGK